MHSLKKSAQLTCLDSEEGQYRLSFSTHDLSSLSFHPSLTAVYPTEPRPFQALPGQKIQPHVRHLTLTHYPSLSSFSANTLILP